MLLRGGGHLEDGAWSALQRVTTIQTFVRKEAILESGQYINVQLRSSTRYSRVLLVVGWRHVPPTWDLERGIFVCRNTVDYVGKWDYIARYYSHNSFKIFRNIPHTHIILISVMSFES